MAQVGFRPLLDVCHPRPVNAYRRLAETRFVPFVSLVGQPSWPPVDPRPRPKPDPINSFLSYARVGRLEAIPPPREGSFVSFVAIPDGPRPSSQDSVPLGGPRPSSAIASRPRLEGPWAGRAAEGPYEKNERNEPTGRRWPSPGRPRGPGVHEEDERNERSRRRLPPPGKVPRAGTHEKDEWQPFTHRR
jgi:hypothetical protein